MSDCMTFPNTVEEFMEKYKVVDTDQVYSNGIEFVPIFRMKQWFEHQASLCEDAVSRQALLDMLHRECSTPVENFMKKKVNALPSVQPEPTYEQIQEYCRKRCLSIVDGALLRKYARAYLCNTCTHWRFKNSRYEDWQCESCCMSYPSYYERRTDER